MPDSNKYFLIDIFFYFIFMHHFFCPCIYFLYFTFLCNNNLLSFICTLPSPCFYEPNYTIQTTTQCQRNNLLNTQFIYIYIYIHINKFFFQRVVGNSATLFKIIYRNTYLKQSNGERSWRFLVDTC